MVDSRSNKSFSSQRLRGIYIYIYIFGLTSKQSNERTVSKSPLYQYRVWGEGIYIYHRGKLNSSQWMNSSLAINKLVQEPKGDLRSMLIPGSCTCLLFYLLIFVARELMKSSRVSQHPGINFNYLSHIKLLKLDHAEKEPRWVTGLRQFLWRQGMTRWESPRARFRLSLL